MIWAQRPKRVLGFSQDLPLMTLKQSVNGCSSVFAADVLNHRWPVPPTIRD
jgi:hypothetical protein